MAILKRDDILQANDLEKELVSVPEWGGEMYVRTMTGEERDQMEAAMIRRNGKKQDINLANFRARLAAATMCDENGRAIFSVEDVAALGQKSALALGRVVEVAMRLNGISQRDVEEITKN